MASGAGYHDPHGADDPYQVLGLGEDASPDDVTRAFRRLARAQHPDVQGGASEAGEQYRRLRGAYELLHDPARRAAYDTGTQERPSAPSRGKRIPVKVRSYTPRRGADATAQVRLSLAEAAYGTTRRLLPGSAEPAGVAVRIPPGTRPGTRLRLRGHGAPGQHGGPPGDLLVTVEVTRHPRFTQHGRDLHTELTVGYPELLLGADVPLQALDGRAVTVHIPPGTSPGTRLHIRGHGVPAGSGAPAGDLIVQTRLQIPVDLTAQARAALTALSAALPPPREDQPHHQASPGAGDPAQ